LKELTKGKKGKKRRSGDPFGSSKSNISLFGGSSKKDKSDIVFSSGGFGGSKGKGKKTKEPNFNLFGGSSKNPFGSSKSNSFFGKSKGGIKF
jgi:hypothetical protein